ncbi:MAG TPA: cyclopropane-fatty-acyl-phospholipid synthase family protein [Acidimicrobiales bacterium]|nr:cyclopropane-fatty-acyl-phospholipid synthase family protein [Acidimicrobiales bacterium]
MSAIEPDTIASSRFAPRTYRFVRLARWLFRRLLGRRRMRGRGELLLVEDWREARRERRSGSGDVHAEIVVHHPRAYAALVFGGSKGLGRSYVDGDWDSPDLAALTRLLLRASEPWRASQDWAARRIRLVWSLRFTKRRSKELDREYAHAHYDLGNEFFALMLDETMAYSCAIFADESTSLRDAQIEKFDRICRKLELGPEDHVLEIGSGWGGFALHAAARYGARVTTTTLSSAQHRVLDERVAAAGLGHLVRVLEAHYSDLTGTYDAVVSIEMIEALDWRRYDEFFATCSRLLNDQGRMALQAITIAEGSYERAKVSTDFIKDLVFPGGCLPSVGAIMRSVARCGDLRPVDLEDIGAHYPRTLALWREHVREHAAAIDALGYDDRFDRLWDLYLGYCEGAFLEHHVSDVQLVLDKARARARAVRS